MTHDPDANCFMDPIPEVTDIFEFLMGEGFVIVSHEDTVIDNVLRRHCRIGKVEPRSLGPSIEDEMRELEGLLR